MGFTLWQKPLAKGLGGETKGMGILLRHIEWSWFEMPDIFCWDWIYIQRVHTEDHNSSERSDSPPKKKKKKLVHYFEDISIGSRTH